MNNSDGKPKRLILLAGLVISLLLLQGVLTVQAEFKEKDPVNIFLDCETNCKLIAKALKKHKVEKGRYPDSLKELTPDYIKAIPKCPATGKDTYSASYRVYRPMDENEEERFTFFCKGANHTAAGMGPDKPLFDNKTGTDR